MNWNKAKNILILFLLFTSLILSAMLYVSNRKSSQVEPQTVSYALELLEKQGITVDRNLIPTKLGSLPLVEAENVVKDYSDFARLVFPDCVQMSDTLFTSAQGVIEFDGDNFSISYTNGIPTDEKLKSPSEKSKKFLLTLGIDTSDADIDTSNNAQGLFTVNFTNRINDLSFFDSKISVTLSRENISSIRGTWFTRKNSPSNYCMLDSAPGLLVKFSAENNDFSNLEILSLSLGYAINEQDVFHKESTILPVYRILTQDGREFIIDARRT